MLIPAFLDQSHQCSLLVPGIEHWDVWEVGTPEGLPCEGEVNDDSVCAQSPVVWVIHGLE